MECPGTQIGRTARAIRKLTPPMGFRGTGLSQPTMKALPSAGGVRGVLVLTVCLTFATTLYLLPPQAH